MDRVIRAVWDRLTRYRRFRVFVARHPRLMRLHPDVRDFHRNRPAFMRYEVNWYSDVSDSSPDA
jgi:hypothetical protein